MADPEIPNGFVRLAVLLNDPTTANPGLIARHCRCDPEHIGHICVDDGQAVVDVTEEAGNAAREGLQELGPTQLLRRAKAPEPQWVWLRLAVGRNHGLTMGQLRKLLERAEAGVLGKIHLNNTHSLVGVHDNRLEAVCSWFLAKQPKLNGVQVRPRGTEPGEVRGSPVFIPKARNQ
jgi:hypothetical protein